MTSTTTAPAILNIKGAPEGIVRLWVPTGVDVSKTQLRNIAAKVAGTINVGRVPAPKGAKYNGVAGHMYDFAPVQRRTAGESAPDPVVGQVRPSLIPAQVWDGTDDAGREALLAIFALVNDAPAKAPAKGKTTTAKAPAKAPREVPAFLRKWENVTCKTCRDFGKVRGPGAGTKAGRAFRTQHGADSAPTAVPCTSHTAKGKGRKTA